MSYTRFLGGKAVSLALTAVLALAATIAIAGYGGAIDKILLREIEFTARETVIRDPSFRGLTQEQRQRILSDMIEEMKTNLGLHKPFFERLPGYLLQTLMLDFGTSWFITSSAGSKKVIDIVAERLPRTILLFTTGTLLSFALGILVGMRMGRKALSRFDRSMTAFALVTNALPLWWTGMLMIILFSSLLKIFPPGGFVSVPPPENPFIYAVDVLYHMLLPLLTIVAVSFGGQAYVTRNIVVRVFQEDYIMAERARGIPERTITYRHALRAASPPIVTMVGFGIMFSIGGAIISEVVFNWPGMGRLFWDAISQQDLPIVIGLTYIFIFLYVILIFVLDLAYGILDPRVRLAPRRW